MASLSMGFSVTEGITSIQLSSSGTARHSKVAWTHVVLSLSLLLIISFVPASAQVPGAPEEQPDSDRPRKEERTWLDRTGIFLDATTGGSYRMNHFSSGQPLLDSTAVDYSSLNLGVVSASVDLGVLGATVLDFEYETPFPKTDFQKNALSYQEDRKHGLEKYTLGVDLTPLWRLLLPPDTPKLLVYLPSFKFRYRQELTQNTATLGKRALYLVPPDADDYDRVQNDIPFRNVASERQFSFRTRYRYASLTWPVYVTYEDSTSAYKEIRVGAAGWTYSRMYVTKFPQVSRARPVIYDAKTDVLALRLNGSYLKRDGIRIRLNLGLGIGDFQSKAYEESLDTLFEPAGSSNSSGDGLKNTNVFSGQLEFQLSYRFSLLPRRYVANLYIEPGVSVDYYWSQFDVFDEEVLRDEDKADTFHQGDWIVLPWMRMSFSIN